MRVIAKLISRIRYRADRKIALSLGIITVLGGSLAAQENHFMFWENELSVSTQGKPMVIDFWATWCGLCIKALKESDTLVSKYKDRIGFYAITD